MKIEFPPDMYVHMLGVDTKWVDNVGDDDLFLVHAAIRNGDFDTKKQNLVTLHLNQSSTEAEALSHGGLMILSNLRKNTMRRALMLGLHMLATNGALGPDDYLGQKKHGEEHTG